MLQLLGVRFFLKGLSNRSQQFTKQFNILQSKQCPMSFNMASEGANSVSREHYGTCTSFISFQLSAEPNRTMIQRSITLVEISSFLYSSPMKRIFPEVDYSWVVIFTIFYTVLSLITEHPPLYFSLLLVYVRFLQCIFRGTEGVLLRQKLMLAAFQLVGIHLIPWGE